MCVLAWCVRCVCVCVCVQVYAVKDVRVLVYRVEPGLNDQMHTVTNLEPTTPYVVSVQVANSYDQLVLERHINTTIGEQLCSVV